MLKELVGRKLRWICFSFIHIVLLYCWPVGENLARTSLWESVRKYVCVIWPNYRKGKCSEMGHMLRSITRVSSSPGLLPRTCSTSHLSPSWPCSLGYKCLHVSLSAWKRHDHQQLSSLHLVLPLAVLTTTVKEWTWIIPDPECLILRIFVFVPKKRLIALSWIKHSFLEQLILTRMVNTSMYNSLGPLLCVETTSLEESNCSQGSQPKSSLF